MKNIMLMVLAVMLIAGTANSQGSYLRLGVGGGIGLKQYNGTDWANRTSSGQSTNYEIKSNGLGGGLNVNLAFGYMMSKYVGLELGVNEFIGLSKKITTTGSSSTSETKLSGMMLQVVPALVITPGLEKINPYARFGVIVGILPSITKKYTSTETESGEFGSMSVEYKSKTKLSGNVAVGFTAAAGAEMSLGEKLSFFAEMVFNGISYAPGKGKITEATANGVDVLPSMSTIDKEWTYEKDYNSANIASGSPDKLPKESATFSNVEINIGIKLKL